MKSGRRIRSRTGKTDSSIASLLQNDNNYFPPVGLLLLVNWLFSLMMRPLVLETPALGLGPGQALVFVKLYVIAQVGL